MKILKFLTLLLCFVAIGCEKQELEKFDTNDKAINIWFGTSTVVDDSLSYNYAFRLPGRDSIMFQYRWTGVVPTEDIEFELEVSGKDKDNVDCTFGHYVIKAGEYEGTFPIYIGKPENFELFQGERGQVTFRVKESADFHAGAMERSSLTVNLRNAIAKPVNWDSETISSYFPLSRYFGAYSDAKYAFVIQTTGLYDFRVVYNVAANPVLPDNTITDTQATYFKALCKTKLEEYESENGPLIDEATQERVVFP